MCKEKKNISFFCCHNQKNTTFTEYFNKNYIQKLNNT